MSNSVPSLVLYNDRLQLAQPRILTMMWKITAAKTITDLSLSPCLTAFDAIAAQTTIDNLLGTSSEFTIAKFDATAMGTDAFAVIVPMAGQCAELYSASFKSWSATGGATVLERHVIVSSTLTDSSLTTECAKGTGGNLAARFIATGLDALTAGVIRVDFHYRPK